MDPARRDRPQAALRVMRAARTIVAALLVVLVLLVGRPAAAANSGSPTSRDVVAVVIGANVGSGDEEPLRYAVSDARRIRDLLGELGDVRPESAILLTAEDPAQVRTALRDAQQRAAALARKGRPVMLLFYYSGHGDDGALHLPKGTLGVNELRAAIAAIPADLRLSILDACRTSGRAKGVRIDSAFELQLEPDAPRGSAELRASAVGEAAQESDELGGAVFTHFLVSGLRGAADADGDGRVTLAELYTYTYRKTLLRTTVTAVVQHPSVQMDLAGAGDVILSSPRRASAFLEVPRGPDRYLVFLRPTGAPMGEISGDGAGRLALPPGKFAVIRRSATSNSVAAVDLSGGGTKRLGDGDFRPIGREELARRGAGLELRPLRVEAHLGGELAPGSLDMLGARAGGALGRSFGAVEVELDASYVVAALASDTFDRGTVHSVAVGPNVGLRLLTGRFTLLPFVGMELRWSWESLHRRDAPRATAAGFASNEDRSFGSAGPRAGIRGALALGGDWSVAATGSFTALLRDEIDREKIEAIALHPVIGASIALAHAF